MVRKEAVMNVGMLWFDDDPKRTLEDKVARAAEYYRQKFGEVPDVSFVHPRTLPEPRTVAGVMVRPARTIQPDHFWIGVRDPERQAAGASGDHPGPA
jgi:hypothetical protein